MSKNNHPNFHAVQFATDIQASFFRCMRGKMGHPDGGLKGLDISDMVLQFTLAVEERVDWRVGESEKYPNIMVVHEHRPDKEFCKHEFELDGGPCSHCGKTYIEIEEEAYREKPIPSKEKIDGAIEGIN